MLKIYLAILVLFAFYPDFMRTKFKTLSIKVIYNSIYFYSACQIKFNQCYNYLLPYFKGERIIDELKIEEFDIDTNNLITISGYILDEINNSENKLFIVSTTASPNKIIIDKNNICLDPEISNITFIALYLNYNGMRHNINLKTDDFNYYLVGNIINKNFVQYYINTVLNLNFSYTENELTTYQLELMDHEVNMIYLNHEQSIVIDKDGYYIINNGGEQEGEGEVFIDSNEGSVEGPK
jgi:hypothetical protein